jgi:hypothetical protein
MRILLGLSEPDAWSATFAAVPYRDIPHPQRAADGGAPPRRPSEDRRHLKDRKVGGSTPWPPPEPRVRRRLTFGFVASPRLPAVPSSGRH